MKTIKALLLVAVLLLVGWLVLINALKQLPRDSAVRQIADPITDWVFALFGGEPVKHFESPEQERNKAALRQCSAAMAAKTKPPEQCAPVAACLRAVGNILDSRGIAYTNQAVARLSKVSLGWQMDLIYMGVEDGDGSRKIIEHVVCLADETQVIRIDRPKEN